VFVFLRFTLDTTPDAAWDALRSPAVFRQASAPLIRVRSREKGGFPGRWIDGTPHEVSLSLLGIFPLGHQRILVSLGERPGGVRMIVDKGAGLVHRQHPHQQAPLRRPSARTAGGSRRCGRRRAAAAAAAGSVLRRDAEVVLGRLNAPFGALHRNLGIDLEKDEAGSLDRYDQLRI
jgi:hypothetical protein